MRELRCGFCSKLLGKVEAKTAKVEIKCKCKQVIVFDIKPDKITQTAKNS